MFPWGFRRMVWEEINEKCLKARRALGWEAVNNAILMRGALKKRRDMGWQLILDHFRFAVYWEVEEHEAYIRFLEAQEEEEEDYSNLRLMDWALEHMDELALGTWPSF